MPPGPPLPLEGGGNLQLEGGGFLLLETTSGVIAPVPGPADSETALIRFTRTADY